MENAPLSVTEAQFIITYPSEEGIIVRLANADLFPPGTPIGSQPTSTEASPSSDSTSVVAAIVGSIIGLTLCIILAFFIVAGIWYYRRDRDQSVAQVDLDSLSHSSISRNLLTGHFEVKKQIGTGIGGKVFLALWEDSPVALKELDSNDLNDFVKEW